jgi:hypothetical protein
MSSAFSLRRPGAVTIMFSTGRLCAGAWAETGNANPGSKSARRQMFFNPVPLAPEMVLGRMWQVLHCRRGTGNLAVITFCIETAPASGMIGA